ncbi:MAG: hydroxymethylbilane synthase [Clostridia bacterium]|nr:hydroxymethylbilane synthase [Clostridia bacterium]
MKIREIVVGSRGSDLAIIQSKIVITELQKFYPEIKFKIKTIKTKGDKILDVPLNKIGDKGLFINEIETALINGEIDFAVHSMKDMPSDLPSELEISCITKREDARDTIITKDGSTLSTLRKGAVIGTSSLRRTAQLQTMREDIKIVPIRGNVQTRINKIEEMNIDGVILAAAGLIRLGLQNQISEYFDEINFVPSVAQGALGIENRKNDLFIKEILSKINDEDSERIVKAERSFMKRLDGGCHVPMGAYAWIEEDTMKLVGVVSTVDGKSVVKITKEANINDYENLGKRAAEEILDMAGQDILNTLKGDR